MAHLNERLLTTKEAAEYLALSPITLATWRMNGKVNIPYCYVGNTVRYRKEDLDNYVNTKLKGV